ncbi:unnamed protein product [Paramecium sonneborni]|uniref:Transmembrane protein n=1 Tax=Paramecium sonneborni TaxID=65129 RepID=A0A8S1KB27_9CILI|nr:unnamed protein product [Paramecium sonneborni]
MRWNMINFKVRIYNFYLIIEIPFAVIFLQLDFISLQERILNYDQEIVISNVFKKLITKKNLKNLILINMKKFRQYQNKWSKKDFKKRITQTMRIHLIQQIILKIRVFQEKNKIKIYHLPVEINIMMIKKMIYII